MTMMRSDLHTAKRSISSTPRGVGGFTLIELMIVVGVIAVLAGIAFTSYQNNVIRSRRAAAAACLMESAQYMERYYTTNLTYVDAALPAQTCATDLSLHYTFSPNGAFTATTYSVQATPQGQQSTKDTKCRILRLDQKGTKTITGTGSVRDCW